MEAAVETTPELLGAPVEAVEKERLAAQVLLTKAMPEGRATTATFWFLRIPTARLVLAVVAVERHRLARVRHHTFEVKEQLVAQEVLGVLTLALASAVVAVVAAGYGALVASVVAVPGVVDRRPPWRPRLEQQTLAAVVAVVEDTGTGHQVVDLPLRVAAPA